MNSLVRWVVIVSLVVVVAPVARGAGTARAPRPAAPAQPAAVNVIPSKMEYSGSLLDATGAPVSGNVSMVFRLFDALTAGTSLWSETQSSVHVQKGVFHVLLGSVTPIPDGTFDAGPRFLELQVGTDAAMTPRTELAKVPNAFYSDRAQHSNESDHASNSDNSTHATGSDNSTHSNNSDNSTHSNNSDNSTHSNNSDNSTHANNSDNSTHSVDISCAGCVAASHIAAGAVSRDKLSTTGAAPGQVLTFDGTGAAWLSPTNPARVVFVSAGGMPSQNGNALMNALAVIQDASASNPYLVKLGPGEFDLSSNVSLKSFVDLEGSGQQRTTIVIPAGLGLVGTTSCEIRELTLQVSGFVRDLTRATRMAIQSLGSLEGVSCGLPAAFTDVSFQTSSTGQGIEFPPGPIVKVTMRDCSLSGGDLAFIAPGDELEIIGSDIQVVTPPPSFQPAALTNHGVLTIRNSTLSCPAGGPTTNTINLLDNSGTALVTGSEIRGQGSIQNEGTISFFSSQLRFTSFQNSVGTAFVGGSYVAFGLPLLNPGHTTCSGVYGDNQFFSTTCP